MVVTGADGFMGSSLTEALVHLGAQVITFFSSDFIARAEQHLASPEPRPCGLRDLTDKTSVDFLMSELAATPH